MTLNPQQQRHLYFGLMHLDRQLTEIEQILRPAGGQAVFARYSADVTPQEQQRLREDVIALRTLMVKLLADHGLEPEGPASGARQAILSQLTFAEVAAEDLGPSNMKGYGPLDTDQTRAVDALANELKAAIARVHARFCAGTGTDRDAAAAKPDNGADARLESLPNVLHAQADEVLADAAAAVADAINAKPDVPNEELRLFAADALAKTINARTHRALQEMGLSGEVPPAGLPSAAVECGLWRLRKPGWTAFAGSLQERVASQMRPHREEVRIALQLHGDRCRRFLQRR